MNNYLKNKITTISFLLMIMVVNIHSYNLLPIIPKGYNTFIQDLFSQGFSRIAVPLFFIISGYLFFLNIKEGLLIEFLLKYKSRFKSLVIPYLFWTVFSCLLYLFLQSIPFVSVFFKKDLVINYSLSEWFRAIFITPSIAFQFWFIQDLIVLVLITPLLYRLIKYFNYSILLLFIIAWFSEFSFYFFASQSILFFTIGALLSIKKVELINLKYKKYDFLFFFIWIFCVFLTKTIIYYQIEICISIINYIHKIGILFGIISIWMLYDRILKNRDISKYNFFNFFSYSFFLFAFHEPLGTLLEYGLYYIFGKTQLTSLLIYLITPVLIVVISVVIAQFIKKKASKFYYIITGGR